MLKRVVIVFLFLSSIIFGRTAYRIDTLDIIADIQRDGSIQVEERVRYDIESINGILYNIDALGYGKLTNLQVFYQEDGELKEAQNNLRPSTGNYTLNLDDGVYKIKLYAPGRNEKKDFIFTYTLTKGVTVYRDIAQLNRKMVGKDWQSSIKNINVKIRLPELVNKKDIYAFGHGPLTGNIEIVNGQEINYSLTDYRPGEFLEVNLLFPKEILTNFNPMLVKNEKALKRILTMEENLAKEANELRRQAVVKVIIGKIVLGVLVLWWVFLVILIYKKNRKRYKVENEYGEYFRELPDDYSPAVAGTLLSRNLYPGSKELFATLLNLVRKGYLKLEEEEKRTTLILREDNKIGLSEEEKFVLDWYIRKLGDGGRVVLEEIETLVKGRNEAREFNNNYERWKTIVYSDMLAKGLKLDKKDKFSISLGGATGIFYFIGGGFLTTYFQSLYFLALTFMGFFLIPYTLSSKRPSLEKEKAISRWEAFKKFLVDYSNLEEAKLASLELWEHYFVYAVALGVAEKVAKGYKKIMSEKGEDSVVIRSGYRNSSLMSMYLYSNRFKNIERSTNSVVQRSIESVARSNRSSTGGRGGGFSGGSSGGGGGRSGGGAF